MAEDRYIDPTPEGFELFKSLPQDEPIHMLNLLRFNAEAKYPSDHPNAAKGWSGAEAYEEYGRTSAKIFARVGGSLIWRGEMQAMVIGPDDKQWDESFIACYPNSAALLEMGADPEYRKAVVNRQAAVLTSRLIRFAPVEQGNPFD